MPVMTMPLAASTHRRLLLADTTRRVVSLAAVLAVLALGWFTLAPVAIGGPASYVVTDGTSMLPKFRGDGLVITRHASSYHVGEIAAYHNAQLHTVVMHRIVAIDGNRFVFKGDNNPNTDAYHPTQSQIVGKEWIYLPGWGRLLTLLRTPLMFAIIMAMVGAYAAAGYVPGARRRRRHHATQ